MIDEEQQSELLLDLPVNLREIGKQVLKRLQKGDVEVPLFPAIATEVMRLANTPDSSASDLADRIQSDLTLAGHVMRVANSAMYTPSASMVSLQQAIARLGMNLICEISLSVALNSKLFNAPGYEFRLSEISQHSFCSAIWSKEVARAAKANVETAFLCGLLHGIGKAAFLQTCAELMQTTGKKISSDDVQLLEDVLHPLFGREITNTWEMPEVVCETTYYCNDFRSSKKYRQQAAVVHAGSLLADATLSGKDLFSLQAARTFEELNLYQDQVSVLLDKRDDVMDSVRAQQLQ